jgi:eukaryotic-like serine/threonine-protein kinase
MVDDVAVSSSRSAAGNADFRKRVGALLSGRYRIDSVIGSGGQGVVYSAADLVDGDAVAIKVLRDDFVADSDWRERMYREARAMASLLDTAAVRIYDQGCTDDGAQFLVMELLHGNDLDCALCAIEAKGERAEPRQILEIFGPVVATLERAHAHGIIHRDIKPANIYLLEGGGVRLLDFGFAKFTRLPGLTVTGFVAGSPSYIAPEIWLRGSDQIDPRVDVYSLGAVAFRALAGRPPFVGSIGALYRAATTAPRPRITDLRPELSSGMDAWVEQALAVEPSERFSTVSALLNALTGALGFPQSQRSGPSG